MITEAYKATFTEALKVKTYTPPLNLYTEALMARMTIRLQSCEVKRAEVVAKRRIMRSNQPKRRRPLKVYEMSAERKRA